MPLQEKREETPLKRLVICGDLKCHKVSTLIFHLTISRLPFAIIFVFIWYLVLWLSHLKFDTTPYHTILIPTLVT